MTRALTLHDIADLRAYERERPEFRARVIALKKRRRVGVGPFVTLVFENRDTIRFQIQEMARVEKLFRDEQILDELAAYNPLIPEPGQLRATLFIELTSDEQMREWLPALVGIQRRVALRLDDGVELRAAPDPSHQEQLTREDEVTASVHYIGWDLDDEQVASFVGSSNVELVIDHERYRHSTPLSAATCDELRADLVADCDGGADTAVADGDADEKSGESQ